MCLIEDTVEIFTGGDYLFHPKSQARAPDVLFARSVNLKRIFIPDSVAKHLQGVSAATRIHLEAYLENLDHLMTTTPREHLVARLVREDDGFIGTVEGASIFFTVDINVRTVFVRRIELLSAPRLRASEPLTHKEAQPSTTAK
jgi:hypothetical protein